MSPLNHHRNIIGAVIACHFISAISTLGLAPFIGVIVQKGFGLPISAATGMLYVLPTLLTAISAPFWGRLADKSNKKTQLLRAQFGLSLSFLLAAFSIGTLWLFIVALVLQGILGGTLAAANGYMAAIIDDHKTKNFHRKSLSDTLNLSQFSARSAFLIAPIIIGFLLSHQSTGFIYLLLALITLLSALFMCYLLPGDTQSTQKKNLNVKAELLKQNRPNANLSWSFLLLGNFMLSFTLVMSFPYFIPLVSSINPNIYGTWAGFLFGLPHGVYLISLFFIQKRCKRYQNHLAIFSIAFAILGISILLQGLSHSISILFLLRLLMGFSMTFCYVSLNHLIANGHFKHREGHYFAWLDSLNKYGGVIAGICAGIIFAGLNVYWVFIGAGLIAVGYGFLISLNHYSPLALLAKKPASNNDKNTKDFL
ncbi:MAG: MFS transporter [Francisellaceae bacterium]